VEFSTRVVLVEQEDSIMVVVLVVLTVTSMLMVPPPAGVVWEEPLPDPETGRSVSLCLGKNGILDVDPVASIASSSGFLARVRCSFEESFFTADWSHTAAVHCIFVAHRKHTKIAL